MRTWAFADRGISEDPHNGLQDLLAQSDEDIDTLLAYLGDFFDECPDAWKQFCVCWVKWHDDESVEDDI